MDIKVKAFIKMVLGKNVVMAIIIVVGSLITKVFVEDKNKVSVDHIGNAEFMVKVLMLLEGLALIINELLV